MATHTNILVDIDALAGSHPALGHAFELARRTNARVTIVDVLPHVPKAARLFATLEIERELVDARLTALRRLAEAAPEGLRVEANLLRGRPAQAIIAEAGRIGADLVIRSHGRDLEKPSTAFGPVDMQLLRHCPGAVWIVGPEASKTPARILAAVDATTDRPEEHALNARILDAALAMRDLFGGAVIVMHAWAPFGEELLRVHMKSDSFHTFLEESRTQAETALAALIAAAGDRAAGVTAEVVKAEPCEAILGLAGTARIDLVVMGTVARKGIAGLVMGNTAERVLRDLRQSVLAIKPSGA